MGRLIGAEDAVVDEGDRGADHVAHVCGDIDGRIRCGSAIQLDRAGASSSEGVGENGGGRVTDVQVTNGGGNSVADGDGAGGGDVEEEIDGITGCGARNRGGGPVSSGFPASCRINIP